MESTDSIFGLYPQQEQVQKLLHHTSLVHFDSSDSWYIHGGKRRPGDRFTLSMQRRQYFDVESCSEKHHGFVISPKTQN
jgi:hypothetical protein